MRRTHWAFTYCFLAVACGRGPTAKPDSTAVVLEQSGGALADRHEAQSCLDSARSAFVRRDYEGCITRLAEAAAYFREQARVAPLDARSSLDAAAEEIETFLANVANGRDRSPKDLDRVYAQAHAAESGMHLAHARTAMAAGDSVRAGEELVMSIDHLERAARDARRPRDVTVRRAVTDTRAVATKMLEHASVTPDQVARASRAIEAGIRRIAASIEVPRLVAP